MIQLTVREKLALRLCAAGMSLLLLLQVLAAQPARAEPSAPPSRATAPTPGAAKLFADSRIEVRDRFSVEVVGSGPDVILIPGLGASRETFRRTAERLRGRFRLHLVQIAGFAGEPARANREGPLFDHVVDALDGYITEHRLVHAAVIGHSLGGELGLALAERRPDHLGRLMIVDSVPFFGVVVAGPGATTAQIRPMAEAMGARTLQMDAAAFASSQRTALAASMARDPADVERIVRWSIDSDRGVLVRAMVEDMSQDLRADVSKVRAPVSVVYENALGPVVEADYRPLARKTLIPVAGALHFIMFDQPAAFDAAVDGFLVGGGQAAPVSPEAR